MAYLQPLHPDRHRVRVVGIVVLGNQHGIDGVAYPIIRPARTYQAPQLVGFFQIGMTLISRRVEMPVLITPA
jgi:hypothetical protein